MSYIVSTSPHIHHPTTTANIMRDVCVALIPTLIASVAIYGAQALLITLVCVCTAIVSEYLFEKICKLPLTIQDSSAIITGALAQYSVHLGSGVVHQIGGTMLSVLPVHSQHRGRLFLPFVDEDPKTAEIVSKVLLFAEDQKIKDPTILEQIQR
jgi:hypothetical protein